MVPGRGDASSVGAIRRAGGGGRTPSRSGFPLHHLDLLTNASLLDHSTWASPDVLTSALEYEARKRSKSKGRGGFGLFGLICCVVVVLLIVGVIFLMRRKKNDNRQPPGQFPQQTYPPQGGYPQDPGNPYPSQGGYPQDPDNPYPPQDGGQYPPPR